MFAGRLSIDIKKKSVKYGRGHYNVALSLITLEEVGRRWCQKEKDTEVILTQAQEYVAIIEHY